MIANACQAGTYVIINPAPWQKITASLLKKVDLLTPNCPEAMPLTGITVRDLSSAQRAANALHQKGACRVIITLGMEGALLSTAEGQYRIPIFPAQPCDTTGPATLLMAQLPLG